MAFDLLYQDRRDLTGRPLPDRRARLEDVVAGRDLVFPVRRLATDGLEAWKQVVERGYEGYVAKDEASVLRGRPDDAVAEGQARGLHRRGGPLAAAHLCHARPSAIFCSVAEFTKADNAEVT
jgi:ATP dependent DNA ligase domain